MHEQPRTHKTQSPLEVQLRQPAGGQALSADTRSRLEPQFQHSFGAVRVHADAAADSLARGFDARAFTVGSDLYFRTGAYQPGTVAGDALLTHELQHTAQSLEGRADAPRRADGLRVSAPNDPLERETRGAGRAGAAGALAGEIVVQRMPEFLAQEQAWEQRNRSPFAAFNEQISPALDGVTAKADEGIFSLAQMADGSGFGGLADFGALVGSGAMHATSGMLGGAAHLVSGLGQMVSTPLSTLGGLGHMAETFLPQQLAMLPRAAHGLFDFATGDHSLASGMDAMDFAFNPMRQMQDQQQMAAQMASGLIDPIVEHAANGQYGEALGRGAFEAALLLGTGGAGAEAAALEETALLGEGAMMQRLEPLLMDAELAEFQAMKTVETPTLGAASGEALLEEGAGVSRSASQIRGSRTPGNYLGPDFDPSVSTPTPLEESIELVKPQHGAGNVDRPWWRGRGLNGNWL